MLCTVITDTSFNGQALIFKVDVLPCKTTGFPDTKSCIVCNLDRQDCRWIFLFQILDKPFIIFMWNRLCGKNLPEILLGYYQHHGGNNKYSYRNLFWRMDKICHTDKPHCTVTAGACDLYWNPMLCERLAGRTRILLSKVDSVTRIKVIWFLCAYMSEY